MFGFFKKKKDKDQEKRHYDPTNLSIRDVRKGWILDYNFKSWEAKQEFEYDWGSDNFSYEFMLESDEGERLFLSLEDDDGLECVLNQKLRFAKLPNVDQIRQELEQNGRPPSRIEYEGTTFYRESETPGYFRNIDDEQFKEFIVWEYWDDDEEQVLSIEQWGDHEFEASLGKVVEEHKFSNFLPPQTD